MSEDRYAAVNIVLVKVPHDMVCRGETDEVVARVRSGEAGGYPDWFADRWVGDAGAKDVAGYMVTVACFEDADVAAKFREELAKTGPEPGGAKYCGVELVDDPAWAEQEARHFSEEWRKARDSEVGKALKTLEEAKADGRASRTWLALIRVKDEGVAQAFMDELKREFDAAGIMDGEVIVTSILKDDVLTVCVGEAEDCEVGAVYAVRTEFRDVASMDTAHMTDSELFAAAAVVEALAKKAAKTAPVMKAPATEDAEA